MVWASRCRAPGVACRRETILPRRVVGGSSLIWRRAGRSGFFFPPSALPLLLLSCSSLIPATRPSFNQFIHPDRSPSLFLPKVFTRFLVSTHFHPSRPSILFILYFSPLLSLHSSFPLSLSCSIHTTDPYCFFFFFFSSFSIPLSIPSLHHSTHHVLPSS